MRLITRGAFVADTDHCRQGSTISNFEGQTATGVCNDQEVVAHPTTDKSPIYLTPDNLSLETPVNGDVLKANWTV